MHHSGHYYVGRCDTVAFYGVRECLHREFFLGRALEIQRAPHRTYETIVNQTSQRAGLNSRQDAMEVLQARNDGRGGT